ncbi:MAG TPA: hypothetical protein VMM76_28540 [Pirellulaceae bacterium]|nr:hypothetical protein [Pirellulaceae bacterium]
MKLIKAEVAIGSFREEDVALTSLPQEIAGRNSIEVTRDFLATHVKSDLGWAYHAVGGPNVLDSMAPKMKIEAEIEGWLRHLSGPHPRYPNEIGTKSHARMDAKSAERTRNILGALKVLLLDPSGNGSPMVNICRRWKDAIDPLRIALGWDPDSKDKVATENCLVQGMLLRSYTKDRVWTLSWPLIIIRACAWSQTGWDQPYLWEAHSALEAKHDHRGGLLSSMEMTVLCYLLRFQSAPGQFCRKTGDDRFFDKAFELGEDNELNINESPLAFAKDLLVALGIVAHAQAFRTTKEPTTNFRPYWDKIPAGFQSDKEKKPMAGGRDHTWHYTGQLQRGIGEYKLELFLKVAEEVVKADCNGQEDIVSFSLGRDSYESTFLHDKLREKVLDVVEQDDSRCRLRRFNELFSWRRARVPDVFNPDHHETCAVVRPQDHILATEMVFTKAPAPMGTLAKPAESSRENDAAWYLFKYLFDGAINRQYISWQTGKSGNYCPSYLVGRFLDVAFQLRPDACLAIPLVIGERDTTPLHLPKVPEGTKSDDIEVKAIARYVCASICNKVMAGPVQQLEQGLKNLDRLPGGGFWSDVIRKEYARNNFARLLGNYVDNYFAVVEHIQFDREILPTGRFLTRENSSISSELKTLVDNHGDVVVLAIDIGATSAKIALFEISRNDKGRIAPKPWKRYPHPFRVLTALKEESGASGDRRRRYKNAREFCDRLLDDVYQRLKSNDLSLEQIHAVGLSWPGPVQLGFIRGWSGILKSFDSQLEKNKGQPVTDDLHDMIKLDIRAAMGEAINARAEKHMPQVIMINDGAAHATGELSRLSLQESPIDHGTTIILKAGTGTAGAVVANAVLLEGLMEFGKLVVNLAYEPKGDYPQGLANLHCSARTLPLLMKQNQLQLSGLKPDLTSLEVGLLSNLDTSMIADGEDGDEAVRKQKREKFHRQLVSLVFESGIIAITEDLPEEIDTVVLGELLDHENWQSSERANARRLVQEKLNLMPDTAWEKLRKLVKTRGIIRLEAILELTAGEAAASSEVAQLINFINSLAAPLGKEVVAKINLMSHAATKCIEQLGHFIGDLAALLCEECKVDRLITGGGVLSGRTRDIALTSAKERLEGYSAIDRPSLVGSVFVFGSNENEDPPSLGNQDDSTDSAVYGLVVEAALALLKQLRQEGLSEIYAVVQTMKLTDTLTVEHPDNKVSTRSHSVNLKKSALTADMVNYFLTENSHDLGIIPAAESEVDGRTQYRFTKWPRG